ncbi:hypothetical protein ACFQ1S_13225, partial [Kibdelosporangium lantanae]
RQRRWIDEQDITHITDATARLRNQNYRRGGVDHAQAMAALRAAMSLHSHACTAAVRAEWRIAVADLASVVAWAHYDTENNHDARRLWNVARSLAIKAHHPRRSDLVIDLLLDLAHCALNYDTPTAALALVDQAHGIAADGLYPVSPLTHGYTLILQAWCQASMGDAAATFVSLSQAAERYAEADIRTSAPWTRFLVDAELAAQRGHARFLLAQTLPEHATPAAQELSTAVAGYGVRYRRSVAMAYPNLAIACLLTGETDLGIRHGNSAITAADHLPSQRVATRLTMLADEASAHRRNPRIAPFRQKLNTAIRGIRRQATGPQPASTRGRE